MVENKEWCSIKRGREVQTKGGEVQTNGGEVQTKGGEVQTKGGEVQTKGGEVQTKGGEVQTKGGEVQTKGGEVQTKGGEVQTKGGEVQTNGGEVQTKGGEVQTKGREVQTCTLFSALKLQTTLSHLFMADVLYVAICCICVVYPYNMCIVGGAGSSRRVLIDTSCVLCSETKYNSVVYCWRGWQQ